MRRFICFNSLLVWLFLFAMIDTPIMLLAQEHSLSKLKGTWIFLEDLTEGRTLERLSPPMSTSFSMQVEEGIVILERGHGSGHTNVRVALDGSVTEVPGEEKMSRFTGRWDEGVFTSEVEFIRNSPNSTNAILRRSFEVTPQGLVVRSTYNPPEGKESVGLYRHAEDIPLPDPASATIEDLSWMQGAWTGTRGTGGNISMEERWSPPSGGAMLAISRTVARGRMSGFEFLRIVERDGGLIYIAQPGGGSPTEFILTQLTDNTAVFANPRHDYPKRITYELKPDGQLTATIGFMKGGTPRRFEFQRETSGSADQDQ